MPLFTEYERTYSAPPEPEPDDHDPNDDRHDPDGLDEWDEWSQTACKDEPEPENV